MIIFNSGSGIVHLYDNIVIQYHYFGVFWLFCLTYSANYYAVTGPENFIVRELSKDEILVKNPWSRIPIMKRFGLIIFIIMVISLLHFQKNE